MAVRWIRCAVVSIGLFALLGSVGSVHVHAQRSDDFRALNDQLSRLFNEGKYAEAVPLAERYVFIARQRYGEKHSEFGVAILWLAESYRYQGRYTEAEPLYKRAVAIFEETRGPRNNSVASSLHNLSLLYRAQGRYSEAG